MTRGRPLAVTMALAAAAALPGAVAAQSFVPQPQYYLLTTDAFDGRALWVQPAGLAKRREATVSLLATGRRLNDTTSFAQYGLTLASAGLGLGWQHDHLADGRDNNTWTVGYGAGNARVSVGGDWRMYRGDGTHDASWDLGGRYVASGLLELSAVWRDIGSPVVLGDTVHTTLVPGLALQLFGAQLQLGADWEVVTKGWGTSAVRAGATIALPAGLRLNARWEGDAGFATRNIAVALTWNGARSRFTGFGASAKGGADNVGLWGGAVADPQRPGRRFGR